eukprot:gene1955-5043_t
MYGQDTHVHLLIRTSAAVGAGGGLLSAGGGLLSTAGQVDDPNTLAKHEEIPGFGTIQEFQERIFNSVIPTVKESAGLPKGDDHLYYSNIPEFQKENNTLCERLSHKIGSLGALQKGDLEGWSLTEPGDQISFLTEINDIVLERVGVLLDEFKGLNRTSSVLEHKLSKHATHKVYLGVSKAGSWNRTQDNASSIQQTVNIPRPQVLFPDAVENRAIPFRPKLTEKPNAIVPLHLEPTTLTDTDSSGQPISTHYYEHPYEHELRAFEVGDSFLQAPVQHNERTRSIEECLQEKAVLIENVQQLQELLKVLDNVNEIAVDLEAHSVRTYLGFTCLMQISTRTRDFLVDTLSLRGYLQPLNKFFTDPNIVKVLHGADSDVLWLQRDHGLYIVNMFDTGQAMRVLGYPKYSLAYLLKHFFDISLDKRYQLSDWRIRPLPDDMILYAQCDTHFLLDVYDKLKLELLQRSNENANLVRAVFSRSRDICLQKFEIPVYSEDAAMNVYNKQALSLSPKALRIFKALHAWRDGIARVEDESCRFVMEDHMLFQLARHAPTSPSKVFALCQPTPTLVRIHAHAIIQVIENAQLGLVHEDDSTDLGLMHDTIDQAIPPNGTKQPIIRSTPHPSRKDYNLQIAFLQGLNLEVSSATEATSTFASILRPDSHFRASSTTEQLKQKQQHIVSQILKSFISTPLFSATPQEVVAQAQLSKKVEQAVPECISDKLISEGTTITVSDSSGDDDDDLVILSEIKRREQIVNDRNQGRIDDDDDDDDSHRKKLLKAINKRNSKGQKDKGRNSATKAKRRTTVTNNGASDDCTGSCSHSAPLAYLMDAGLFNSLFIAIFP